MININKTLFESVFNEKDILGFKYYRLNSPTICHWHNQLELVWIKSGELIITMNNETFTAAENTIVLIPVGTMHSYQFTEQCIHHVFIVDKSFFPDNDFFNEHIKPFFDQNIQHIIFSAKDASSLFEIFAKLEQEYYGKKNDYIILINGLVQLFFVYLKRHSSIQNRTPTKNFDKYKEAIIYITTHYNEDISMLTVSRQIYCTPQHLCRIFKTYSEMTFNQYLTAFRLEKAKLLLSDSTKTIEEIAHSIGFNDVGYFIRVYKKHFNITPGRERKE